LTEPRRYFVGIDDTDYGESIGTGALARELRLFLMKRVDYACEGVTRHQLLVDDRIPYTSHNSSACLVFRSAAAATEIAGHCKWLLDVLFHPGADPGLCVALEDQLTPEVQRWGARAQTEVLTLTECDDLARRERFQLEPLGGDGIGIIGALAACGLRSSRLEGRFILLDGMRQRPAQLTVGELTTHGPVEVVIDDADGVLAPDIVVATQEWMRPFFHDRRIALRAHASLDGYRIPAHKHRGDQ
jgi:tRNA(Ile2) C34 agmatinyltransferase TiaS